MGKELIEKIKAGLASMKRIEATGFADQQKAADYFREKEVILESIVKALESVSAEYANETEALKSTVKSLRDELKGKAAAPRKLSRRELLFNLGKAIAAAWSGNHPVLGELAFTPNLKSDNWTNPREVSWGERGWQVEKSAFGSPMGNIATNDQYLINPVYETEIMQDAAKKSVMMPLVRHRPMAGPWEVSLSMSSPRLMVRSLTNNVC
jgi:hypothetical protein